MKSGYIYILSNPALVPDCLKIGFTKSQPELRCTQLSAMSAIPLPFRIEHYYAVRHAAQTERRLHLVLNERRMNTGKEFFLLPVEAAADLCEKIVAFQDEDTSIASHISLSNALLGSRYAPDVTLRDRNMIYALIGATTNNTQFDRLQNERRNIVDGFLASDQIADHFEISRRAANRSMSSLAKKGKHTVCHTTKGNTIVPVFEFIRYHMGHLAWKFSDEFRRHFANPKF